MAKITDSYTLQITVIQHGNAQIVTDSVVFPSEVEANEPFDISYDVRNDGAADTLMGHILEGMIQVPDSNWEELFTEDEIKTKTITHPGISGDTSFTIEVGHV